MSKTIRIPPDACLDCKTPLDAVTDPITNQRPKPGDITICLRCGHVMAFGKKLRVRPLTDDELIEMAGDPEMIYLQKARAAAMLNKGR